MPYDYQKIGQLILKERGRINASQAHYADQIGIHRITLRRLEHGQYVTGDTLQAVFKALGLKKDQIAQFETEGEPVGGLLPEEIQMVRQFIAGRAISNPSIDDEMISILNSLSYDDVRLMRGVLEKLKK